jgi:hypothetical protein
MTFQPSKDQAICNIRLFNEHIKASVSKELPTAQQMREVATNDLSGPGDTLHKHDIRRGAYGRTDRRGSFG